MDTVGDAAGALEIEGITPVILISNADAILV